MRANPNRWHSVMLPDDYIRKMKQDLSELEAQIETKTRYEPDPDYFPPPADLTRTPAPSISMMRIGVLLCSTLIASCFAAQPAEQASDEKYGFLGSAGYLWSVRGQYPLTTLLCAVRLSDRAIVDWYNLNGVPAIGESIVHLDSGGREAARGIVSAYSIPGEEYGGASAVLTTNTDTFARGHLPEFCISKSVSRLGEHGPRPLAAQPPPSESFARLVRSELTRRGVDLAQLVNFRLKRITPAANGPGRTMWLVDAEANPAFPSSETGNGEPAVLRYWICSVCGADSSGSCTILYAGTGTYWSADRARSYFRKKGLPYLYLPRMDEFGLVVGAQNPRPIDIDGDGIAELVLNYGAGFTGGTAVLRHENGRWKVKANVAGYD